MSDTHGSDREPTGEQDPAGSPAAPPPSYPQYTQYPQQPQPPAPQQQPYPQQPPQYAPQPPSPQPYGQQPGYVYGVPPAGATPPGHYPYGQQPYGQYAPHLYAQPGYGPPGFGQRDPDKRPGTVLAAGIVTLVLSSFTLLFAGVMLIALVAASAEFIEGFTGEAGFSGDDDSLFTGILIVLSVMAFWCVAAIVLAILALRRVNWARIMLVVSSGVTVAVSLVAITGGASVVTLLGAIAVIVLVFTGGANEWYRGRHDVDPALPSY